MESRQLKFEANSVEEAMSKARAACGEGVRVVYARRLTRKRGLIPMGPKHRFELVVEAPAQSDFEPEKLNQFAAQLRQAVTSSGAPAEHGADTAEQTRTRNAIASYMAASPSLPAQEPAEISARRHAYAEASTAAESLGGNRVYGPSGPKLLAIEPTLPPWAAMEEAIDQSAPAPAAAPAPVSYRPKNNADSLLTEAIAGLMGIDEAPRDPGASIPVSTVMNLVRLCELPPLDRPVAVVLASTSPDGTGEFEPLVDAFKIPMASAWDLRKERVRETMRAGFDPELLREHLTGGHSFAAHIDVAMEEEWRSLFAPTHHVLFCLQVDGGWDPATVKGAIASMRSIDVLAVSGATKESDLDGLIALDIPFATLNGRPSTLAGWITLAAKKAAMR